MLAPDRIRPFLRHAEPDVRAFATQYFADCWSRDPDVLPAVLDAFAQYRTESDVANLQTATRLALSESALDRVLALLDDTDDPQAIEMLNRLIAHAPGALLRTRVDAVEASPKILPMHLIRIRRRRGFLAWSGKRLADELRALAQRSAGVRPEEFDYAFADDLADAVGRQPVPDAATLCGLLAQSGPASGWLADLLIDVAGRRGLREAIPLLVDKLAVADDLLPGRAAEALARIGDPAAVRLIRERFPSAPFHFKLFACEALGYLKLPESEAAVLDLLEREEDEGVRMWLCVALADLLSERTVEVLSNEVARARSEEVVRELCAPALIAATILGVDPPANLKAGTQEREPITVAEADVLPARRDAKTTAVASEPDAARQREAKTNVAVMSERGGKRVSRNAPCPCGSGKKYKKCCGQAT